MARIRTIKPEFFDDEKLASCSRDARLTFVGIITQSDDYGVVKGSPAWLRSRIFPYDDVTITDITSWIGELERLGILKRFSADGEQYIGIRHWDRHQKVDRPSAMRNPEMPDGLWEVPETLSDRVLADDAEQTREVLDEPSTNIRRAFAEPSLLDLGSGIKDLGGDQDLLLPGAAAPAPPEEQPPPFISLPTNKQGLEYHVTDEQVREFRELYPNVDVEQTLRNMRGWLLAKRERRKTIRGMPAFMNSWLAREQDRPRPQTTTNSTGNGHTGKRNYCPDAGTDAERRRILGIG